jgi:hypothetical protein
MPRIRWSRLALAIAFVPVLLSAQQQRRQALPADRLTIADYLSWEDVGNPQLSPDGRHIIYTRSWIDGVNDRRKSALWIMDADGSRQRFLVEGSGAVWSPDGTRIAYLADGEPSGSQIYVRWMDAEGATSQVTRLTESPSGVQWSPDGQSLSFHALVPKREQWALDLPPAPRGARWTEPPRVVTSVQYRRDRQGFIPRGARTCSWSPPTVARRGRSPAVTGTTATACGRLTARACSSAATASLTRSTAGGSRTSTAPMSRAAPSRG